MNSGEFLTRGTIWVSIAAYAIGCVVLATARRPNADRWTRLAWTVGCGALLTHIVSAYQFFHSWSHASAYAETARQTAEVVKINWGGGLFINYAGASLWVADVTWWWFAGLDAYRARPWLITLLWHGFLIFILFNATVVFKDGLVRWVGLFISVVLFVSWYSIRNEFAKR